GVRRRTGPDARAGVAPRRDPPRRAHARARRARGVPPPAARRRIRHDHDRDADRRGATDRRRARPRSRGQPLPDQTVLARRAARFARTAATGGHPVDARGLAEAGAPVVEADVAYTRLNAAYQQSLRYAQDVRRLYVQLQRGVYQSLLGLANALEAKDPYTRGHSERVSRLGRRLATTLDMDAHAVEVVAQAGL